VPEPPESDRRRDPVMRAAFDRVVLRASETAAQHVARIHRRRLVTQAFLAALIVTAGMGLALFYFVERPAARDNARYDCHLIGQLSDAMETFVQTDAHLRAEQARSSVTPRLLADLERLIPVGDLRMLFAASARASAQTVAVWENTVAPRLRALAGTDCDQHFG
jgi:hypothetical protein